MPLAWLASNWPTQSRSSTFICWINGWKMHDQIFPILANLKNSRKQTWKIEEEQKEPWKTGRRGYPWCELSDPVETLQLQDENGGLEGGLGMPQSAINPSFKWFTAVSCNELLQELIRSQDLNYIYFFLLRDYTVWELSMALGVS